MLTFFHGWRRKMGVATLVTACVFAAGWVRSQYYEEGFTFATDHDAYDLLASCPEGLTWQRYFDAHPGIVQAYYRFGWKAVGIED